jgi:hypothetical protein
MMVARQAMYRADDMRGARLVDMSVNILPTVTIGPARCLLMSIVSYKGKTNQVSPE